MHYRVPYPSHGLYIGATGASESVSRLRQRTEEAASMSEEGRSKTPVTSEAAEGGSHCRASKSVAGMCDD
jgi:hypothetical protein